MNFSYGAELRHQITRHLADFQPMPLNQNGLRPAAVAVVIVGDEINNKASVLMTRRPAHLNRHSSQFALPGGRLDDGETPIIAALRELDEELGLSLGTEDILGILDDYPTRSGYRISPVVMWGGAAPVLVPDTNEVAHVFKIPLHELDSPDLPETTHTDVGEHPILSVPLPSAGGSVYAPTAAVLYQFREVALRGADTRVSHFDQPKFAWT